MSTWKIALGIIATTIGLIGYIPYFRDMFRGTTKPHVFSWFVWALLTGIAFFAQLAEGGGAGAWVTGFTSLCCLTVSIFALTRGEKNITRLDWVCFLGALSGIVIWQLTSNPLYAVLIVIGVDGLAYVPTFRKAYHKPFEETVVTYALDALKYAIGIMALESYSLTTWLYPAFLILADGSFAAMALVRRRQIINQ